MTTAQIVNLNWSPQQSEALVLIRKWLSTPPGHGDYKQVFYLAGYAGTGKTTLAKEVHSILIELKKGRTPQILSATFTGKAALVLRTKGISSAQTIHSLIYSIDPNSPPNEPIFILNKQSVLKHADLLIVDEVSMVGEEHGKDLESFGTRILVLGDIAQLPPISGAGYFTSRKPDYLLTEIHRQAKDSPIIMMATAVRVGTGIKPGRYGECEVFRKPFMGKQDGLQAGRIIAQYAPYAFNADQTICGLNKSRHAFNSATRRLVHPGCPDSQPIVGDKLICLKNNSEKGLLNGGMWEVTSTPELQGSLAYSMDVKSLDIEGLSTEITVPVEFFKSEGGKLSQEDLFGYDQFDFGYAITCHKSQGSQWDHVFIYNENWAFREDGARWLYTALTRASKKVVLAV